MQRGTGEVDDEGQNSAGGKDKSGFEGQLCFYQLCYLTTVDLGVLICKTRMWDAPKSSLALKYHKSILLVRS